MKYYTIEPEVAGSIADSEFLDRSARPPKIAKLKYEFDGWLGDDIVDGVSTFIVTDRLRDKLNSQNYSGYLVDFVEVTTSDQFNEIYPDRKLPTFFWLKVTGLAGRDDFGISSDNRLVISEKVYNLMNSFSVSGADFEEYNYT